MTAPAWIMVSSLVLTAGAPGKDDKRVAYQAVAKSSRELSRQVDYLLRAISTLPGPQGHRDLFEEAAKIQYDLIYFQQQVRRKAPREALTLAFDKVDERIDKVMTALRDFENWDQGVRLTARRVQSAEHDLHYALFGGAAPPIRNAQTLYRQTLALLSRIRDMETLARYVFEDKDAIRQWSDELEDMRLSLAGFQRAQKNKLGREEVKGRFIEADRDWQRLVRRLRDLPERKYYLLRSDALQIEQGFANIAGALGIDAPRAKLPAEPID